MSIIWVSRDTGIYYYPPRGDANRTYSTIATQYFSLHVWLCCVEPICPCYTNRFSLHVHVSLGIAVGSIIAITLKIALVGGLMTVVCSVMRSQVQ